MSTTIQQVIDTLISGAPGAPFAKTIDTFKCGSPEQPVRGIVTTFLASCAVIQQAADLGANLIITHEPTFYNHLDAAGWLPSDPVYEAKQKLLAEHQITIWRFHDYWHSYTPDGIHAGVEHQLDWGQFADPAAQWVYNFPPRTMVSVIAELKHKLGLKTVRFLGKPEWECRRVGLVMGQYGGENQVRFLRDHQLDLLVVGEINEWETNVYVQDALSQGQKIGLVIAGHAASEEPGMAWLAPILREQFPGVPVHHVPFTDELVIA